MGWSMVITLWSALFSKPEFYSMTNVLDFFLMQM